MASTQEVGVRISYPAPLMNNTNPCKEMTWADVMQYMYGQEFEKESINELEKENMQTKLDTQDKVLAAVRAHQYIVGSVTDTGTISFSSNPFIHANPQSARNECERLARMHKDKLFIFVQLYGAVGTVLKPAVVHV